MAAAEPEVSKRGPEAPSQTNLLAENTGKRLPEYSSREEEFIEENYVEATGTSAQAAVKKKTANGLESLHEGTALLKYTRRNGVPHFKFVQLSPDNTYLRWYSKKKSADKSTIRLENITSISQGQKTEVFRRSKQPQLEVASFSVIYNDGSDTFDVVAKGSDEAEVWYQTLSTLHSASQEGQDVTQITDIPVSLRYIDRYRIGNRDLLTGIPGDSPLDESAKKTLRKEVNKARGKLDKVKKLFTNNNYSDHPDCAHLQIYYNELLDRAGRVEQFLEESQNDKISRSDVWRLNVDCDAVLEKSEVCAKEL